MPTSCDLHSDRREAEPLLAASPPPVEVRRHRPNYDDLAEEVGRRVQSLLTLPTPTGCIYVNPATTVLSSAPTDDFFAAVRKAQSNWCRQASLFPRRIRRKASRWVNGDGQISNKFARFLDRSLCFTGILFIHGRIVPPHAWPARRRDDVAAERRP